MPSPPAAGVTPFRELFRLNGRLLIHCLDGLDEAEARRRPSDRTNNAAFLAAHLVDARHFLCRLLGAEPLPPPFAGRLEEARSLDDVSELPSLSEIRSAWEEIGRLLDERLATAGAADLGAPSPQAFPIDDATVLGGVAFLAQHESYHIGQLALLRKLLGHEAMGYR